LKNNGKWVLETFFFKLGLEYVRRILNKGMKVYDLEN
jgi:hypothetical protein